MKRDDKKADGVELLFSGSLNLPSGSWRRLTRTVLTTMLSLLWLMAGAAALYGQQTSATLVGSITDSNSAVVRRDDARDPIGSEAQFLIR